MKRERLLELAGIEIIEEALNVKNLNAAALTKALNNNGMMDKPKFGDIHFMKIGNGPKKDGQYMVVVYDDGEDAWMITWIYAWEEDGKLIADWSGDTELEGFKEARFANAALKLVARKW